MNEILLLSNPSKRRKKAKKSSRRRSSRKVARKSSRRVSRRRSSVRVRARRNPSVRNITAGIVPTIKGGFFGAIGALGNDLAYGYGKRFLPAVLQSGMGRHATKLLSAVLIGVAGNYVLKGRGGALAIGAATVTLHEAIKEQIATFAPSLPLGAMDEPPALLGDSAQYVNGMGEYMSSGMGEYMHGMGDMEGIGGSDD